MESKITKETIFWNWFSQNSLRYCSLNRLENSEVEEIMDDFLQHLHDYNKDLYFQIRNGDANNELIISAEGRKDRFAAVNKLVSNAPKIEDWDIIAFKQPANEDFTTNYEGVVISSKNVWFIPLENQKRPKEIGIRVFIDGYLNEQHHIFEEAIRQMLMSLLGEMFFAKRVSYIDVKSINLMDIKELIPISDLKNYIVWKAGR